MLDAVTLDDGGVLGVGHCWGGCASDADCAKAGANQHCQTDQGLCVTTPVTDVAQGQPCDLATTACDCITAPGSSHGFCAQFCWVGGSACSAGSNCETLVPTSAGLLDGGVGPGPGWTQPNAGLGGFCAPTCDADGGTTLLDGGACPSNSTCQSGTVGAPDCRP
jgi:hypothetical protein